MAYTYQRSARLVRVLLHGRFESQPVQLTEQEDETFRALATSQAPVRLSPFAVARLRDRLRALEMSWMVLTVRGKGYRLAEYPHNDWEVE